MIPRNFLREDLDRLKGLVRSGFGTDRSGHPLQDSDGNSQIINAISLRQNVIQLFEHIFGDIFKEM